MDLLILAMPVNQIIKFLKDYGASLPPGMIVVDFGSTKKEICLCAQNFLAEGVYFSDSQATLIEGKGVGTTQFALEILYLFHNNYKKIKLTTEEVDDEGRELRIFWERMGFVKLGEDEKGSVDMEIELTLDAAQYQYERYIKPR